MNAPGLQRFGKENEGSTYQELALKQAPAFGTFRVAFQDSSATGNSRTNAGRDASHPKLEAFTSSKQAPPSEGLEEAQTSSKMADPCDEKECGPSPQAAPAVQRSTVSILLGPTSAELQKPSAATGQLVLGTVLGSCAAALKVHPADMLDAPIALEGGRCYTEILQVVKLRPDKSKSSGPLWRLPGPAFGPMQRTTGQGSMATGKEAPSQVGRTKPEGAQAKARAQPVKQSKLPRPRTYTEMAERQGRLGTASLKGALRQGSPSLGAAAIRAPHTLKPGNTESAVEQANRAAMRALDQSRLVPGRRARKLQMQAGKENTVREAANTDPTHPAAFKRPISQTAMAPRATQTDAKGKEPCNGGLRKEGIAPKQLRAPFRPGGNALVRSMRPSAMVDLNKNYTTAHKRMQEALQKESRMAEDKVKAAEWDVARTWNKQRNIEKALEEQSLRTSQERKMARVLLSSEHTLQEMERAGSISAVRSTSGQSMTSVHNVAAAYCITAAATPLRGSAAPLGRPPAKGPCPVPEENPQLAQVYDMSVLRAAQRHPRRQLLTDVPQAMPEHNGNTFKESELSQGQSGSRRTVVLHASADTSFPEQSIKHNPFFGETLSAKTQDHSRMSGGFGRGHDRSNPTFEPSNSSSLLQPSSQNTVRGPARSGQRSMPCSAMELSSAVHGASLPSRAQSTAPERNAQGSRRAPQQRQKALQQVKHQRGRVLPTSASLGRLTVPSSLRAPPEPSSELTVTGPCLDLPSCLRQLVDLRNVSECQSPAGFPTCNSSASGGQASAPLAAPFPAQSVGANEVDAQCQAVTAVEGGAQQEACSASEQHAAQQGQIGQLPFASHVQLFGQVLCEQLRDEESPTLAHPEPWRGKEDRGVFSSTLSFLDKVRPSERFSPLETSLGTPMALPGAALDYPLSETTQEQGDSASSGGGARPKRPQPKTSLVRSIRAALIKCCHKLPCSSTKAASASPATQGDIARDVES